MGSVDTHRLGGLQPCETTLRGLFKQIVFFDVIFGFQRMVRAGLKSSERYCYR